MLHFLSIFQTSKDGNTTTSTLSLIPKKEDSGKYLSCRFVFSHVACFLFNEGMNAHKSRVVTFRSSLQNTFSTIIMILLKV